MKIFVATILLHVFMFNGFAQERHFAIKILEDSSFSQNEKCYFTRPLTWEDFHTRLPENKSYAAETINVTEYRYAASQTGHQLNVEYKIKFYLDKKTSAKKESANNSYLLNHEQRHCDIAWYFYKKFIYDLSIKYFTKKNYHQEFENIYKNYLSEMRAMQKLYDDETQHSIITEKQNEWNEKIDSLLKSIADFTNKFPK